MKNILHPKKQTLIVFSLLSFAILTLYVRHFSFAWEFVVGVTFYILILLLILLIGFLIAFKIDKKKKAKLRYYFIISISQLLTIWILSIPVKKWQIEYAKKSTINIVTSVEKFKIKYGIYPKSLSEMEQKLNLDIPDWTALGTKYDYELLKNGHYTIGFKSYSGYDLHYEKQNKKWISND